MSGDIGEMSVQSREETPELARELAALRASSDQGAWADPSTGDAAGASSKAGFATWKMLYLLFVAGLLLAAIPTETWTAVAGLLFSYLTAHPLISLLPVVLVAGALALFAGRSPLRRHRRSAIMRVWEVIEIRSISRYLVRLGVVSMIVFVIWYYAASIIDLCHVGGTLNVENGSLNHYSLGDSDSHILVRVCGGFEYGTGPRDVGQQTIHDGGYDNILEIWNRNDTIYLTWRYNHLESIAVGSDWKGKTERGLKIGDSLDTFRTLYPVAGQLEKPKEGLEFWGWRHGFFTLSEGRLVGISIS